MTSLLERLVRTISEMLSSTSHNYIGHRSAACSCSVNMLTKKLQVLHKHATPGVALRGDRLHFIICRNGCRSLPLIHRNKAVLSIICGTNYVKYKISCLPEPFTIRIASEQSLLAYIILLCSDHSVGTLCQISR